MTITEINKYPKSKKELSKFAGELLNSWNSMVSQGEEQPVEITQQMSEQAIEGLIWSNPRILLDFFGKYDLNISVAKEEDRWYFVWAENTDMWGQPFNTRREAEEEGYLTSFKELEKIL